MKNYRPSPVVSAGSMADIAFLLLIFFLVSTSIPKDKGIARALPRLCPPGEVCSLDINERNVLRVQVNEAGELFVNNELEEMSNLKEVFKNFIDNNGDGSCTYCNGERITESSDNPNEASIAIGTNATTAYKYFITVQDQLTEAYYDLREVYMKETFNKTEFELTEQELKQVRAAYPFRISEAAIK